MNDRVFVSNICSTLVLKPISIAKCAIALTLCCGTAVPAKDIIVRNGETVTKPIELDPGDSLTINEGGAVTVGNARAVQGQGDTTITNNGLIVTSGNSAIGIEYVDTIKNSGTILTSGRNSYGILADTGSAVKISGTIKTSGFNADAIGFFGDSSVITNDGTIQTTGVAAAGIQHQRSLVSITNENNITNNGTILTRGNGAGGIVLFGDDNTITNTGFVLTVGDNADGINADGDNEVSNSGVIETTGINSDTISLGSGSTLTNSGTLSAAGTDSHAVLGSDGTQTVNLQPGTQIIGKFDLGPGKDIINVDGRPIISSVLIAENVESVSLDKNFVGAISVNGTLTTIAAVDLTGQMALGASTAAMIDQVQRRLHALDRINGAWSSAFGQRRDFESTSARLAYTHAFGGAMGGYETAIGIGRLGILGGASSRQIETDPDSAKLNGQSLFAGAYLNSLLGPTTVTTSVMSGFDSTGSERIVIDNINGRQTAEGTIDSVFVSTSVGVAGSGWTFANGSLTLRPSGQLNYTASFQNDFSETGAGQGNLTVDSRMSQHLSTRAQLAMSRQVVPALRAVIRTGIDARTSFEDDIDVALIGKSFTQSGSEFGENFVGGFFGLGANYSPNERLSISGDAEYQFGQESTETFAAGLNFNLIF